MTKAHFFELLLAASLPFAGRASAQTTASNEPHAWGLSAAAYAFFVPEHGDYVQPVAAIDHDFLHLEARYNYEDRHTGSIWAGYNLSGGRELSWTLTPMLAGVFGNTDGLAPGYEAEIGYWILDLQSEGEYVFNLADASEGFFYNWSELALSPLEWLRFGVVVQRTRVYQTDRDIQRGLLVGVANELAGVTTYVFNPDDAGAVWVVALELNVEP
jgi:hypothetical protein